MCIQYLPNYPTFIRLKSWRNLTSKLLTQLTHKWIYQANVSSLTIRSLNSWVYYLDINFSSGCSRKPHAQPVGYEKHKTNHFSARDREIVNYSKNQFFEAVS